MNILNKEAVEKGNKIIVTKTVEEEWTIEKIHQVKHHIQRQKQGIISQSKRLQEQYNNLLNQELEIKEYEEKLSEGDRSNIEIKDT